MIPAQPAAYSELEPTLWRLYRDFFDMAERKRRWRIRDDIPWDECNPNMDPAVADVVESFCAVELYLPDYLSKVLPLARNSKSRTWFYANWGYEESKHSLVLCEWLIRSRHRSEEYMTDFGDNVLAKEWNLPIDTPLGMLAYAMVQEHATFLNYRNLRQRLAAKGGDPALDKILGFISVDERAHYTIFRDFLELFLKVDRDAALAGLRPALNRFQMPAIHDLLDNSSKRIARIRELELFNEEIFMTDVYNFVLREFNLTKHDLRDRPREKKSMRT